MHSDTDVAYPVEGGNIYFDPETGTITGCDVSVTAADIPSKINGVAVTAIGEYAFAYWCKGLTSVTIPNSVTSIDRRAFYRCASLTGIWVDENNKYYSSDKFGVFFDKNKTTLIQAPAAGLEGEYVIPDSVTSIDEDAFCECASLTSVSIPDGVTTIGESAFEKCTSLTSVTIPNSVTSISESTFSHCTSLTNVSIGNSVTRIDTWAFSGCKSLTSVTIPNSVTSIDTWTFSGNESLTSVTIPNSVTSIGAWMFDDTAIYNNDESWIDGVFYIDNWLIEAKTSLSGDYSILDGTCGIAESAFKGCENLTSVTIPDSVTSIDVATFEGCTSLTSVTIPDSVTNVGSYAFDDTAIFNNEENWVDGVLYIDDWLIKADTSIDGAYSILDGTIGIANSAFKDCESLTSVTIPDKVTSIANSTFSGCLNLTSATIGKNVTSIGEDAFYACMDLTSVCFLGDAPQMGAHVFQTWVSYYGVGYYLNHPGLTLYYIEGKEGWTSPTWNGYPTATWNGQFIDVSTSQWYASAVEYVVENGLMNGMGKNEFRPEEAMTRAMLVTVLWRYAGPPVEGENTFHDLTQDWYIQAVAWASSNGIVNGYPDGTFKPDEKVTREQLATIVYRYCNTVGIDTSARADLGTFPDANKVNSYASDAISWAVSVGLITGITHGGNPTAYLEPQTSATRAQVATILMRFIENVAS